MSWGLGSQLKVALGIWALLFLVGVIPLAILHNWRVGTLPIVEGTLSNHHIVEVKYKNRTNPLVKATLEFDGPKGHCKHDEVQIGIPSKPESFATEVQVAVRKDSCHGYYILPLQTPTAREWLFVFVSVGLFLVYMISFLHLSNRFQRTRDEARLSGTVPRADG